MSESPILREVSSQTTRAAQFAVGVGFGALARLRGDKPVHPRGVLADGVLERVGSDVRWGIPWIDELGVDEGIARFSRSVGLPAPLPDILGLAIRLETPTGKHDLLLATTGTGPGFRHVLLPRRHPLDAPYGSLMPYESGGKRVMFAAVPDGPPLEVSSETAVAEALLEGRSFQLLAAEPMSDWVHFARLTATRRPGAPLDQAVSFDPVRNPLPDLSFWPTVAPVRESAYRAARDATASRRSDVDAR